VTALFTAVVEYDPTPLPPDRQAAPTIGVRLLRDPSQLSGWRRSRITAREVDQARRARVPVCASWDGVDLSSGLYDASGVVVLDRVTR
jgi:hypothetical protein